MKYNRVNRKIHYWGSAICDLPILIIIVTGLLLIFKKDSNWIQPPTIRGVAKQPEITFAEVLEVAKASDKIAINNWSDINRLDVRPSKGMLKIRSNNGWELQIDTKTKDILSLEYRRSDIIEAIHTGTFFSKLVSYTVFLPAAVILLLLWITGLYLFVTMTITKRKNRNRRLRVRNV